MEKLFKEFYQKSLSQFVLDTKDDEMSSAIGIKKERVKELTDKFQSVLEDLKDKDKKGFKRSDLWVNTLYHAEPKSLIEVMCIGNMIGAFEYHNTINDEEELQTTEKMLIKIATVTLVKSIEECKKRDDWKSALDSCQDYLKAIDELI